MVWISHLGGFQSLHKQNKINRPIEFVPKNLLDEVTKQLHKTCCNLKLFMKWNVPSLCYIFYRYPPSAAPTPAEAANAKSSAIFQGSTLSAVKSLYRS